MSPILNGRVWGVDQSAFAASLTKKPRRDEDFTPAQDFIRHMMSCTRKGCTTCEGK